MNTLYHYCSNNTFKSIIENNSVWLSSLSLSNDFMEGKLVREILINLAIRDSYDNYVIKEIDEKSFEHESSIDGFGLCLSEEGDLLSQWRGYAEDATGVSIGFSKNYLEALSEHHHRNDDYLVFKTQKIAYKIQEQMSLIEPIYKKIQKIIYEAIYAEPWGSCVMQPEELHKKNLEVDQALEEIKANIAPVYEKAFLIKMESFIEEKEWRIIYSTQKDNDVNSKFRVSNSQIISFHELFLQKLDIPRINKVILGPKNKTPIHVVRNLLLQSGFGDVEIIPSKITYR